MGPGHCCDGTTKRAMSDATIVGEMVEERPERPYCIDSHKYGRIVEESVYIVNGGFNFFNFQNSYTVTHIFPKLGIRI